MRDVLKVHFLDVAPSEAVQAKIRQRADRLARYSGDIEHCQVWLASPRGLRRKSPLYGVRIIATVPDEVIVVDLQPTEKDPNVAVREAFDAARRKLRDYGRRRRGPVKARTRAAPNASRRRQIPSKPERESLGFGS